MWCLLADGLISLLEMVIGVLEISTEDDLCNFVRTCGSGYLTEPPFTFDFYLYCCARQLLYKY